jgi:hypothetical protein
VADFCLTPRNKGFEPVQHSEICAAKVLNASNVGRVARSSTPKTIEDIDQIGKAKEKEILEIK